MDDIDRQLKQDIEDDLSCDPRVDAAQIRVSVEQGAVSLMGEVHSYPEKWAAEDAVDRVGGTRARADELTVALPEPHRHTDAAIRKAALEALKWDIWGLKAVTVQVRQGRVTLGGLVRWGLERTSAERAVRCLAGVVHVNNEISISHAAGTARARPVRKRLKALVQDQSNWSR